jgi:hypothetical protein
MKCAAAFRLRETYTFRHQEACTYLQRHVQVIHRLQLPGLMFLHPARTCDTPIASLLTMETPIHVMHVVAIKDARAPWDGMTPA